ncbi:MAG: HD domain-containing protein [Lachnospiraceae bacterium]|jgi:HD superfamily phosphodiesterase|nr:HD domain-containing protein [Lachnospiraceae bacterium]
MVIDRQRALAAFQKYTGKYDITDEKVKLKIDHTYRVCALCEQIAAQSGFDEDEIRLSWLTGLLHDVGRFEQLRRYGTFIDAQSIDHAEFGADILFREGKIRDYVEDASEDELLEKAVRCHSAYRVPEDYTPREKRFADLLRDADKIDIVKVNVIVPIEEIYNVTTYELTHCSVTEEVLQAFYEEHCILRNLKRTPVDNVVGHISLVYELVYPVSCQIVQKQGYLHQLMDFHSELPKTNEQFAKIREKMEQYLKRGDRGRMMKRHKGQRAIAGLSDANYG